MFTNFSACSSQALKTNADSIPATHCGMLDVIFGLLPLHMSSKNQIFVISDILKVEPPPKAKEPSCEVQNEPRMCRARPPSPV
jgi:hypothetical protein